MSLSPADIVLRGIVGLCGRQQVFMGFAPANLLHSLSFADVLNEDTGDGYQRRFSQKHSVDFRRYIRRQNSTTIPLTFNLRPETNSRWALNELPAGAELRIKAGSNRIFSQVDCQHRIGSLSDLDITLAFMTFVGLSLRAEMEIFSVINSKAKGLNASLLDYHESKLLQDVATEKPQLYIALRLNDEADSPWYKQLACGGNTIGMHRRASLRTMQNAVKRFLKASNILNRGTADDAHSIIRSFWIAVSCLLSQEWSDSRKHFLTKGIGVYALMSLAAQIYQESGRSAPECSTDYFVGILSDFLPDIDWSHEGPLKGLGGETGAQEAYELINRERLARR
jgi:DGQHR domain-containing protein